jgi:hypothetical protein
MSIRGAVTVRFSASLGATEGLGSGLMDRVGVVEPARALGFMLAIPRQ